MARSPAPPGAYALPQDLLDLAPSLRALAADVAALVGFPKALAAEDFAGGYELRTVPIDPWTYGSTLELEARHAAEGLEIVLQLEASFWNEHTIARADFAVHAVRRAPSPLASVSVCAGQPFEEIHLIVGRALPEWRAALPALVARHLGARRSRIVDLAG